MSVTFRRKVSYNGSTWSAWQSFNRNCGFLDLGVSGARVWIEFDQINIPVGEQFKITNNDTVLLDMTGPVFNGVSAFQYGTGTPSGAGAWSEEVICGLPPDCSDDSDCGPCEKCVDGECVPCECSDGRAQLIMYLWHPVEGDTVRVRDVNLNLLHQVVDFGNFSTHYLYSYRLTCPKRFESGDLTLTEKYAEPITGILGDPVQRQLSLLRGQKYVDKEVSDYLYRTDIVVVAPVLFGFTGEIVLDLATAAYGKCNEENSPAPSEPLKPPITQPPPTEPPEEPEGGDEPVEIDEPLPPDPETPLPPEPRPPEPQNGCECEIYQAKMMLSGFEKVRNALVLQGNKIDARLADSDRVIFGRLTSLERVLYQQLSETNRLLYQISNWFGNVFFSEVRSIKESVQSMSDDLSDIRDSLRLTPCEPDYPQGKTITQIADDFEKYYYPATVEVLENDVVLDTGPDEPDIFCRKLRN